MVTTANRKKRGRPHEKGLYQEAFKRSEAWQNFTRAIHSKATMIGYCHDVQKYMAFLDSDNPDQLLKGNQTLLENQLMGYIESRKADGASSDSIRRACASIKKFYDRNRIPLSWPYILGTVGTTKRRKKDGAYTSEVITKIRDIADLREKVLISLFASSGIRKGAVPELTIGDLSAVDKYEIYRITVYAGYEEEYMTFCSTECRRDMENYFEYRMRCGEPVDKNGKLMSDAPLIREVFNAGNIDDVKRPQKISESTIYGLMDRLAQKAGLRKRVQVKDVQKQGSVRHEIKLIHGLRKFFDTQCTNAGMNPLWVDMLEGHDVKLKGNYYRPTEEILLEGNPDAGLRGYVHCIDALTINQENRLRKQLSEMTKKQTEVITREEFESMKAQLRKELFAALSVQAPNTSVPLSLESTIEHIKYLDQRTDDMEKQESEVNKSK